MELSIVIPAYNAGKCIKRTILSIKDSIIHCNCTSGMIEVIVVDDGSTDDTELVIKGIIEKENLPVKYLKQENQGVSVARNNGLKEACGEYVFFMDADDCIDTSFFSILLPCLKNKYQVVFFGYIKKTAKKFYNRLIPQRIVKDLLLDYLKGKVKIGIWSFVAQKRVYSDNGIYFKKGISYGEDIEVVVNMLLNTENVICLKECLYIYDMTNPDSAMNKVKFNTKTVTSIKAMEFLLEDCKRKNSSRSIIKGAKNRLLTEYYIQKRALHSTQDKTLEYIIEPYTYIEHIVPPIQFSKFYLFNLYNYIRCRFQY